MQQWQAGVNPKRARAVGAAAQHPYKPDGFSPPGAVRGGNHKRPIFNAFNGIEIFNRSHRNVLFGFVSSPLQDRERKQRLLSSCREAER
jgi:hypothetical protein